MNELSGGSLNVKFYEANKLVPPLEIFDAVTKGAVDMGYAAAGFWLGKLPAASIFSSVPYGPDSAEYLAWMFSGGGLELYQQLYGRQNMWVSPCGIIAPEASGWFREEIKGPEDLKGLKMRFYALGALVMEMANPRHAHEHKVYQKYPLPENMMLVAGVIDSKTNYVEHPEVVADRIQQAVDAVGGDPTRVVACTDCGFSTSAGMERVVPGIVWEKLKTLREGADLASQNLSW